MTSKERIRAVFEGRVPDKVPINHISVSSRVASRILGREAHVGGGINRWREAVAMWNGPDAHAEYVERTYQDAIDIALALDHDIVRPIYWRDPRMPAARMDEYTFRYESDNGSTWEVRRLDPETEMFNLVESHGLGESRSLEEQVAAAEVNAEAHTPTEANFEDVRIALDRVGHDHAVRAGGLHLGIPISGEVWLEACLLQPELVGRYLDAQLEMALKNIPVLTGMGAEYLFGGDDFASELGPVYSPRVFHDLMLPRLKKISDTCHEHGVYHLFGSDGNLWPVAEDLYGASGIDGHFEADRKAGMDILGIHERYPHITVVGNIPSFTLHVGTVEEVTAVTRDCMEEARRTNKAIVGCSNIIVPETPQANMDAMLATIAEYR